MHGVASRSVSETIFNFRAMKIGGIGHGEMYHLLKLLWVYFIWVCS